ncbi:MAG TPA: hypothetical protein PLQ76_07885 [bacterium]|nr:hypothetical protein [bacterium]
MRCHFLKFGNLMGSPDLKAMMRNLGDDNKAIDALWDDVASIKLMFGLDGRSTSALILAQGCPALFPALVDCSFVCADPHSFGDASVSAAISAIESAGLNPAEIKSLFITHPHADHFDSRLLKKLPNATAYSHPDSGVAGTSPLNLKDLPKYFTALNTPGHGTPHCSFIFDFDEHDLSICFAGDLIMSHAHFLSLDQSFAFSDVAQGKESVRKLMSELDARNTTYKMIVPGHDIPFFTHALP